MTRISKFLKRHRPTEPEQVPKRNPERAGQRITPASKPRLAHHPESTESSHPIPAKIHRKTQDPPDQNSLPRESERASKHRETTKKADVLRFAKRRLLEFTPGGQFPNQTEKLREPDSNRRPRGYEPRELPGCSIPRCFVCDVCHRHASYPPSSPACQGSKQLTFRYR